MTKLAEALIKKKMSQRDLQRAIQNKFNVKIGDDRISKMSSGRLSNYNIKTCIQVITNTYYNNNDKILDITELYANNFNRDNFKRIMFIN